MEDRLSEMKDEKPTLPNEGRPWLQLMIQEDGSIKVTGFVNDKILAYGLLGAARDAIKDSHDKEAKIERVNNSGGLVDVLRRRFK